MQRLEVTPSSSSAKVALPAAPENKSLKGVLRSREMMLAFGKRPKFGLLVLYREVQLVAPPEALYMACKLVEVFARSKAG